jgi:hypothetical protein
VVGCCLLLISASLAHGQSQGAAANGGRADCISLDLQANVDKRWHTAGVGGGWTIGPAGSYTFTLVDDTGKTLKQTTFNVGPGSPAPNDVLRIADAPIVAPGQHTWTATLSGACGSVTRALTFLAPQGFAANYLSGLSFQMTFTGHTRPAPFAGCYANSATAEFGSASVVSRSQPAGGWKPVSPSAYFSTELFADKPYVMGGQVNIRPVKNPSVTRRIYFSIAAVGCPASLAESTAVPMQALVLDTGEALACGSASYTRPTPTGFALTVTFKSCGDSLNPAPDPATSPPFYPAVAKWAMEQIGQTTATLSQRKILAKYGMDWQPGGASPVGEWSGDGWRFASLAWMQQNLAPKTGVSALAAVQYYARKGKLHKSGAPPAGAILFYTGAVVNGIDVGHAAISIGNGQAVTTNGADGANLPVSQHGYKLDGLTYQGYVVDPKP